MNTLRQRRVWLPLLLLALILAAAAALRLRGLNHTEMTGDQGILYTIAMSWVSGGPLPLTANKASAGIMNPPLVEYLIALPMMLRPVLLAAVQFQVLLSLGALLLLYLYAARLFTPFVALLATFLFALNPWAVHYSRFVWNPNPVPFFSTLLLGSWLLYLSERRAHPLHLTLAVVAFAAATQLHLSSLVLLGVLGISALLFWRRLWRGNWWASLWPLLLGVALALLLYLPYLVYEAKVGWADLGAIAGALAGGEVAPGGEETPVAVNLSSWLLVLELATGANLADGVPAWREAILPGGGLLFVTRLLLVAAIVYAGVRLVRDWLTRKAFGAGTHEEGGSSDPDRVSRRTVAYVVLALWLLVPAAAYVRHTVYLQNYYFLYIWPAPFLLIALMLDDLLRWLRVRVAPAAVAAAAVLLVGPVLLLGLWQFHLSEVGLDLVESGEARPALTLGQVQALIDASQAQLAAHPGCELIMVAEAALFENSTFGLIKPFVAPRPVRLLQAGRGYIVPEGCALYLLIQPDALVEGWLAQAGAPLANVPHGGGIWTFYHLSPAPPPQEEPVARWENGLALLAAEAPAQPSPSTIPLTYRWQVIEEPPDLFYHFFNHVLNEQGELVSQVDAVAIDTRNWRQGDRLVVYFEVPLPELASGEYTLLTGLYTWPDIVRVPLTGGEDAYQVLRFAR